LTVFLNVALSSAAAYIIHVVVDETFRASSERNVLQIIKDQVEGLIVFDETFCPIFCTAKARILMKVDESKDMSKVLMKKGNSIKTLKRVVGELQDGEADESWINLKGDAL